MKKHVLIYSMLCLLGPGIYSDVMSLGTSKNLVSYAYSLLRQSPPDGYKMLATCGGTVGGTGLADDFDGDGVCNGTDIDDDNDGVADAVESPGCFYTATEAGAIVSVKTALTNDDGANVDLPFMHNSVTTSITASNNVIAMNQAVNGAVIYEIEYPTAIKLTSISHFGTTFGASATAMVQGSNDNVTWDNLMTAATAATANPKTFTVNNNTTNSYRYYRIVKVAGTTTPAITSFEVSAVQNTAGYNASVHPKITCTDPNIDNDNMLAHMDLDTDGDGCSDALEAGASTNMATDYQFPNVDANEDGLVDAVDTDNDGFVNYTSTYTQYATVGTVRACIDTDGDGVLDIADLDDDNDGLLDVVEMAPCEANLNADGSFEVLVPVASQNDWNNTDNCNACNNVHGKPNNSSGWSVVANSVDSWNPTTLMNGVYRLPTSGSGQWSGIADGIPASPAGGVFVGGLTVGNVVESFKTTVTNLSIGVPYKLSFYQANGGIDGTTPVNPADSLRWQVVFGSETKYSNAIPYLGESNQVWSLVELSFTPSATTQDLTFITNNKDGSSTGSIEYIVMDGISLNKTVGCEAMTDTDNDGIPNHLDLDSDGDGCPDLTESGVGPATDVITPSAANAANGSYGIADPAGSQLDPGAADANNDGLNDSVDADQNGQTNYISTYSQYALASNIRVCDYDGDSSGDIADHDDDNDGVLDAIESPACFYTAAEANVITTITSQFASPDDDQTDRNIQLLHDGATAQTFNFTAVAVGSNPAGSNLFTIQYPTPVMLATLVVSDNISITTNANAIIVGSNDGVTWSSALSPPTTITGTPVSFNITTAQSYKYYRIQTGSVSGALAGANTIGEITSTLATGYVPAAHPKPTCTTDTDGDGIVNHLDLDSDGDGCPDATEGGGGFTSVNLVESILPGGNSGTGYTGQVNYAVDDNLGNDVDANGVPVAANGGQAIGQSQVAGTPCPENEPCTLEVGGTIFKDLDGAANGVNGIAVNGTNVGLFVSLLSGGSIQEVAAVQANGTYRFASVQPGSYRLVIGTNPAGTTTPVPPANTIPVAEGGSIDEVSGNSMGDGSADGMTDAVLTCPAVAAQLHFDFGLDSPLPVTLVSFKATQSAEGPLLSWTTADEKDFDRFEVEQSAAPKNGFIKIGTVKGGGSAYSYLDGAASTGANYYRLKMVDADGTYAYSKIVTVPMLHGKDLHWVYPNPSQGHSLFINSKAPIESCKVYDAVGREIKVELVGSGETFKVTFRKDATPGIYIISYKADGRVVSQKFVVSPR
jgi:hypothetical protein